MSTLRTLTLIRHAQADGGFGRDRERRLSPDGEAQAVSLARALAAHVSAQMIVHSSARRTTQTAAAIAARQPGAQLVSVDALYGAWVDEIVDYVRALPPHVNDVVIVGHQPTIGASAAALTGDDALGPVATGTALILTSAAPWTEAREGTFALCARIETQPGGALTTR